MLACSYRAFDSLQKSFVSFWTGFYAHVELVVALLGFFFVLDRSHEVRLGHCKGMSFPTSLPELFKRIYQGSRTLQSVDELWFQQVEDFRRKRKICKFVLHHILNVFLTSPLGSVYSLMMRIRIGSEKQPGPQPRTGNVGKQCLMQNSKQILSFLNYKGWIGPVTPMNQLIENKHTN